MSRSGHICKIGAYVARYRRRTAIYGSPVRLAAPYPAKPSLIANLIAIIGMCEGWGQDFARAAYRRWFQLAEASGIERAE